MLIRKVIALALASLMLANCATAPGQEDDGVPWGWIIAGVAAVAVVVVVAAAAGASAGPYSDERLKRDIKHVDTLPNGLQLYSFRYWNDERTFVSVMAQDLLEDER